MKGDGRAQHPDERLVLREAMDRLLRGEPLHSDGKLTIKSLADEAQVKRWVLTHKHTDLQDEFRTRIAQIDTTSGPIWERDQTIADLQDKVGRQAEQLQEARATIARLERVVQVLTLENEQLGAASGHAAEHARLRGLPGADAPGVRPGGASNV